MLFTIANLTLKIQLRKHDEVAAANRGTVRMGRGSVHVAGQWIDIAAADGGSFKGYLTVPASGSGPGILLLQEIFGVNSSMRDVADYYAEEGYVVLAPDLFWRMEPGIELGYSEADFNKAFGYYQRFDANQSIKDAADALKVLRARP